MAGKGDKPRNCFSKEFRKNYDEINWSKNDSKKLSKESKKRSKTS